MQVAAQAGQQIQQQQQQQQQFPPQHLQQRAQLQQQAQAQLQLQLQQQQHVLQQMQVFQEQRLKYIQGQTLQQGQVLQQQQNVPQGQMMQDPQQLPQQQQQQQQQHLPQQQQQHLPQQQQQQQQLNVQLPSTTRTSFQLDTGGMSTPRSPGNRPPSPPPAIRQSASPMRPPSEQPASRQSFNMSVGDPLNIQGLPGDFRQFSFYKPLKSSRADSRVAPSGTFTSEGNVTATSSVQGPAGGNSSSIMQSSHQQMSATTNNANEALASSAPQPNAAINPAILSQYPPMAEPPLTLDTTTASSDLDRQPSQTQKSSSTSAPTSSSGKISTPRQQPHESTLSHDEVRKLANQLSCEEKIIWVSRQILGTHGSNGFQRAMSNMQKLKRQRARQYKKQHQDETDVDCVDQERLKAETFNVKVAEKMIAEMNQGLQFCDLMADTIKSILREIDPDNPLIHLDSAPAAPSLLEIQKNPRVADTMAAMHAISSAVSASLQEPNKGGGGRGATAQPSMTSIMKGPSNKSSQMTRPSNTGGQLPETVAQGNPQGSTLRKLRKRSSVKFHGDRDLVALIGDHDDNGKKLSKKELSSRLFEATRFRTLNEGDYVAAKVSSQDLWLLARVVKQWNAVDVPLKQILDMSDIKREALFREKVYIQENDEYNGDLSSARAVKRQHILPLARSHVEGNEWGKRLRKGSRVYAIYPQSMTLYSATVVDCTTYCRNQDDVIVVEFDGDEDDRGVIPQRHTLARFVTLVPREFETNRRKRKSTSDAARRRSSKVVVGATTNAAPPSAHQADNMLLDMYGDASVGSKNVSYDDIVVTGLTPGSTPPPGRV